MPASFLRHYKLHYFLSISIFSVNPNKGYPPNNIQPFPSIFSLIFVGDLNWVTMLLVLINWRIQLVYKISIWVWQLHPSAWKTWYIISIETNGSLCPARNMRGGYYFVSLSSGRRINQYRRATLPMPNEVIDRINYLSSRTWR